MTESKLVNGLIWKDPHQNAPEFIKGKISIKVNDFMEYISQHQSNGWLNIELKQSRQGKMYFELDEWKPTQNSTGTLPIVQVNSSEDISIQNIPF